VSGSARRVPAARDADAGRARRASRGETPPKPSPPTSRCFFAEEDDGPRLSPRLKSRLRRRVRRSPSLRDRVSVYGARERASAARVREPGAPLRGGETPRGPSGPRERHAKWRQKSHDVVAPRSFVRISREKTSSAKTLSRVRDGLFLV